MHHFEHPDGHVNFNSDLSGDVQVVNSKGEKLWVSGLLLVNFVATYVKDYILPRMKEAQARIDATEAACRDQATPEGASHSSK
jgi:hypothetical protein